MARKNSKEARYAGLSQYGQRKLSRKSKTSNRRDGNSFGKRMMKSLEEERANETEEEKTE